MCDDHSRPVGMYVEVVGACVCLERPNVNK